MYNQGRKKKEKLYKFKGCEDCQKNCPYNSLVAIKDVAERGRNKFPCNLNIAKVWIDKTFKEENKEKGENDENT